MGQKVDSFGPLDAKIAIVGEAPGAYEEREGKPFVGPSGTLLRDILLQVGINPDEVFYANLCRYKPPANELKVWFDDNGMPNDKVMQGLAELKEDLQIVRPNVIVPVGNFPLKMLTRMGRWDKKNHTYTGIGDYRGSILEVVNLVPGLKAVPTYHPASVLRMYTNKAIAKLDLARALQQSQFPEIRRPQKNIIIDPRGEERQKWRDWLLKDMTKILTFDIEYIGEHLLCVGMTVDKDYAVVVHTQNKADVAFVQSILESGISLNAQNSMFDCSILEWFYGFDILRYIVHDTMLAAHACYIEFPKALDFLVSIYTEQPFYKDMINWKKVAAGEQPISDVLGYNGIDTWTQHDIMEQQLTDDLLDPDFMQTFRHEIRLISPLWDISKFGVKIDTARLATLQGTLETEAATLMAGLKVMAGRDINPKSGPQVAKFLFGDLGLPVINRTAKKQEPKTDDTTLGSVLLKAVNDRQRTGVKLVREARERLDLISKFCEIELDDDGRMRCHYDPAKTDSGRLSSRKFYPTGRGSNLQNVPRDPRVRSVFIPDSGCLFGYADLMQAESLVVSHITQDPEMLRLHHTPGLDGHAYVASYLFEKDIADVDEEERYIGKKCRHALNYLMGWYRLMTLINAETQKTGVSITAAQAKVYVARYLRLHNYLPMWWREVEQQLYKDRTLHTLLNRKRVFYDRIESILPNAVAFIPQGTVADALNIGLIKCGEDEELKDLGFQMLLQVHDAIGYQFPEANVERVNTKVRELLTLELYVPKHKEHFTIPVEIKVGYNWGEKSKKDDTNPNGLIVWNEKVAA